MIAIASMGNPLRGDDGLPERVVKMLEDSGFFDADFFYGEPMNFLGKLAAYDPILLVDAVVFDESPGSVKVFNLDDLEGAPLSTHSFSLGFVKKLLSGKRVFVIGVCPASIDFSDVPSLDAALVLPYVKKAISSCL